EHPRRYQRGKARGPSAAAEHDPDDSGELLPLNDGASAVVLATATAAEQLGVEPLARVVASATHALDPQIMGIAPASRSRRRSGGQAWFPRTSTYGKFTRGTPPRRSGFCVSCRAS